MNENDTQAAFTKFHKLYKSMYDKAFPVIKVKFKYNNRKPWLSDELKDSIKLKNKLYKKSITTCFIIFKKNTICYYDFALPKINTIWQSNSEIEQWKSTR